MIHGAHAGAAQHVIVRPGPQKIGAAGRVRACGADQLALPVDRPLRGPGCGAWPIRQGRTRSRRPDVFTVHVLRRPHWSHRVVVGVDVVVGAGEEVHYRGLGRTDLRRENQMAGITHIAHHSRCVPSNTSALRRTVLQEHAPEHVPSGTIGRSGLSGIAPHRPARWMCSYPGRNPSLARHTSR